MEKGSRLARRTEVRLWVDEEVFPRVIRLIMRAKHTIFIQMFIWKDDPIGQRVVQAIIFAADQGVFVEIEKEAVGDLFEHHQDFLTTQTSDLPLWQRFWHHDNIRVTHAGENNHGKVFIIDGSTLLLTGANIALEYHIHRHDYMVELRGRRFIEEYLSDEDQSLLERSRAVARYKGKTRLQTQSRSAVELVLNTANRKDIRPVLRSILEGARESIVVEHAYLDDRETLELLAAKSRAGVRVTIILWRDADHHYHVNMQSAGYLLKEGDPAHLRVVLYPRMVHAKIILVDRSVAFIGSANLIPSSLDQMGEVNVLVRGKHKSAVRKLRDVLRRDLLRSRPMKHGPWKYGLGWWLALLRL